MPTRNFRILVPFLVVSLLVILIAIFAVTRTIAQGSTLSPETMLTLEEISDLPFEIVRFDRQNQYLFATVYNEDNFFVLDTQNSAYPQVTGTTAVNFGWRVTVSGDYAYLAAGSSVNIIDISNPEMPMPIATYSDFEWVGNLNPIIVDIAAHGQTLYVALHYQDRCPQLGRIAILDMSDPTQPQRIGTLEFDFGQGEIEIRGDYAYVLWLDGMSIYDISTPGVMTHIGGITLGGIDHNGGRFVIEGDFALLTYHFVNFPCGTSGDDGWYVVDITKPIQPYIVFGQDGEFKNLLSYSDGYLFAGSVSHPLHVFEYPFSNEPLAEFERYPFDNAEFYQGFLNFLEFDELPGTSHFVTSRIAADTTTISPTVPATLSYTDTLGVTQFDLPAGSVISPTVVSVLPLPKADFPPLHSTQVQAFDIRGHLPDYQLTLERFQQPVTATLPVTISRSSFTTTRAFLYWAGTHWVDAATTCASFPASFPEISKFPGNLNTVHFCRPGKYGIFELPVLEHDLYLPAVFRQPS